VLCAVLVRFLCSGESNPDQGSERERRASLLLDLAAFVEENEEGTGAGFDATFDTVFEGEEGSGARAPTPCVTWGETAGL
jgi:hypothetical protein